MDRVKSTLVTSSGACSAPRCVQWQNVCMCECMCVRMQVHVCLRVRACECGDGMRTRVFLQSEDWKTFMGARWCVFGPCMLLGGLECGSRTGSHCAMTMRGSDCSNGQEYVQEQRFCEEPCCCVSVRQPIRFDHLSSTAHWFGSGGLTESYGASSV